MCVCAINPFWEMLLRSKIVNSERTTHQKWSETGASEWARKRKGKGYATLTHTCTGVMWYIIFPMNSQDFWLSNRAKEMAIESRQKRLEYAKSPGRGNGSVWEIERKKCENLLRSWIWIIALMYADLSWQGEKIANGKSRYRRQRWQLREANFRTNHFKSSFAWNAIKNAPHICRKETSSDNADSLVNDKSHFALLDHFREMCMAKHKHTHTKIHKVTRIESGGGIW